MVNHVKSEIWFYLKVLYPESMFHHHIPMNLQFPDNPAIPSLAVDTLQ